jgi:hypothetical protein
MPATTTPNSWIRVHEAKAYDLGFLLTQHARDDGTWFQLRFIGGPVLVTTKRRVVVDAFLLGFRLGSVRPE